MDDAAPRSIATSPTVNLLARPLPPNTLNVRLLAISTPPTAAMQSAENAAVQESDPVDSFASAVVRTHAVFTDAR